MTNLELEDIRLVSEQPYEWNRLQNSTLLISGGTGFIGSFIIDVFRYRNEHYHDNIKVVSISRHGGQSDDTVTYYSGDVTKEIKIDNKVDYVLHLASYTHPQQYSADPVGTILTNISGCKNLLEFAKSKSVKRFLLASSVEIYGLGREFPMDELCEGINTCNDARSGYNESKRLCESLCHAYKDQYGIDCVIARLSRVFGADKKIDTKAMAQFINKAVSHEDIVLNSKGLQHYSYCYVADAASAIIKILLDGQSNEAYNIADDYDGLTLGEYAQFLAQLANTKVIFNIKDDASVSKAVYALLDTKKLKDIGWKPMFTIQGALQRTFNILTNNKV